MDGGSSTRRVAGSKRGRDGSSSSSSSALPPPPPLPYSSSSALPPPPPLPYSSSSALPPPLPYPSSSSAAATPATPASATAPRRARCPSPVQSVAREIRSLVEEPPTGVRYVPAECDALTTVDADITGPEGTPFDRGTFRVRLLIGKDYPAAPPRAVFLTRIFHPNVSDTTGAVCVDALKPPPPAAASGGGGGGRLERAAATASLGHILAIIRCLLIVPYPESSLNAEAGKMVMEDYDGFARRAALMTAVHASAAPFAGGGGGGGAPPPPPTAAASAMGAAGRARKKAKASKLLRRL